VVGVDGAEFVVADIPGLIAGAHEGKGIGDRFLGHVERCAVLLHLVDGTSEDVVEDYQTILNEVMEYGGVLAEKPRITALNKVDALDEAERAEKRAALKAVTGSEVFEMSGVSQEGLREVLRALRRQITQQRDEETAASAPETDTWQP